MKALLDVRGRSLGGTGRRRCAAGDAHPTVRGHLAAGPATTPAGRLVAWRFRLRAVLGRGGMGRVWLADDEVLDRPVAVKQVLLHGLGSLGMRSEAWACALNEARSAARVDHEGAVKIYDIVEDDRCPWIVMEPLPGRTLQQALNVAGPLPARQVTEAGLRLLDVQQATRRAGIVHGDVKPANVHLCGHGRIVLTDFGIAYAIGDACSATGTFPGTPAYVAPERLDGGECDRSLACSRSARHCSRRSKAGRPPTGARWRPRLPPLSWTRQRRPCALARYAPSSKDCSPRTPPGGRA
jgi:serine/threonine protein kinase